MVISKKPTIVFLHSQSPSHQRKGLPCQGRRYRHKSHNCRSGRQQVQERRRNSELDTVGKGRLTKGREKAARWGEGGRYLLRYVTALGVLNQKHGEYCIARLQCLWNWEWRLFCGALVGRKLQGSIAKMEGKCASTDDSAMGKEVGLFCWFQ
jgi:hypothetical protein